MENFKVICKNEADRWFISPTPTKVVTNRFLFWTFTNIVEEDGKAYGPSKDEICIVIDIVTISGESYYVLLGYGNNNYISKCFIRLDAFTETEKEIAEKTEYSTN